MNDLTLRDENVPAIADDFLIAVADQAEKRVDAVMKIKKVALKVTNARDWTDQNGNPYLQVSGSEKIANLFNISWRIDAPICEEEADGHFTYSVKGEFSLGGRTIEVEGTRSSKDSFFNRYDYNAPKVNGKAPLLPPSSIDKGDVKKAALTNLYGNGITRILGIRNLTWADLEEYAGIKKDDCGKVDYKQKSGKPEVTPPQSKSNPPSGTINENQKKLLYVKLKQADIAESDFLAHYGIEHVTDLPAAKMNEALKAIADGEIKPAEPKLPEVCAVCGEPYIKGACHNPTCPEGKPFDE